MDGKIPVEQKLSKIKYVLTTENKHRFIKQKNQTIKTV